MTVEVCLHCGGALLYKEYEEIYCLSCGWLSNPMDATILATLEGERQRRRAAHHNRKREDEDDPTY